jgi:transcription antitermination factor NusG
MPRAPKTPASKTKASRGRPERRRAPSEELHAGIEPGARVRVVGGAFSGKVGVVQELDAKGGARVMLGLLSVRFKLKQLTLHSEARARPRPVLGSSHRKPLPARS